MYKKTEDGKVLRICDKCGFVDYDDHAEFNTYTDRYKPESSTTFNLDDCNDDKDYCLRCHPRRMSYRQLIEWLARGNGYLCQQAHYYTTAPVFKMCPVIINDVHYPGMFDDQIPYNEHELVVSAFKNGYSNWKIPTLEMYEEDCLPKFEILGLE